jgi:hypothetical protein
MMSDLEMLGSGGGYAAVCHSGVYVVADSEIGAEEALAEYLNDSEDREGEEHIRIVHVTDAAFPFVENMVAEDGPIEFNGKPWDPNRIRFYLNDAGELDIAP